MRVLCEVLPDKRSCFFVRLQNRLEIARRDAADRFDRGGDGIVNVVIADFVGKELMDGDQPDETFFVEQLSSSRMTLRNGILRLHFKKM